MMEESFSLYSKLLDNENEQWNYDGISGKRLASRLDQISKIGLTEQYGSNRPGFSKAEKQAKDLVASWMKEAGLDVRIDGAGNVIGRLRGRDDHLPAIMSGSHLDSVPNGGHFDGVLGVLVALEVVEAWKETGYQPNKPYEVVIFTDEEGARFNGGFHGSEAMTGQYELDQILKQKDGSGLSFEEVLEDIGLSVEGYTQAKRQQNEIEMFVEVHIEQGKRLEQKNLPCGIVTGIAGPCWLELIFEGQAAHAGTTSMDQRQDALLAASECYVSINPLPMKINDSAVLTVGKCHVEPNGVNVIAGRVTMYVDIRDIHEDIRDQIVNQVIEIGEMIAKKHNVKFSYKELMRVKPTLIQEKYQNLLKDACLENGVEPYFLPSGAGHDAMIIGEKWPIAMLFVRSKAGISHHPEEWTDLADCVKATQILKSFLESIQNK